MNWIGYNLTQLFTEQESGTAKIRLEILPPLQIWIRKIENVTGTYQAICEW